MKIFILILISLSSHAQIETRLDKTKMTLVNKSVPTAIFDIRYLGNDNFVGDAVSGYKAPLCYLSHTAAKALFLVQKEIETLGLTLKIFDCYRPQMAVDHFVRWAKDLSDTKTKTKYYPNIKKNLLFKKGYISSKSGHSRGSSIDLTLADKLTKKELDMGTGWDYLDPKSHTANPELTLPQRTHRLALKAIMEKYGFENYRKEWWHFTFKPEAYPKTYFNFDVL
ncbi:MAG: peptidase M15 [Halobacteriovoraceae bacterium]|nr:peptidase M15 [Halobacteriovoraceae bacterium]|tara:strand:- start:6089 stop:6760 length:672 start_codon:yes stop_codon:yes gene_type:complete